MRQKRLKHGEVRVIRISESAMFEFMCETIIENGAQYFDLSDVTTVTFEMHWHHKNNEFSCVIYNRDEPHEIDFDAIADKVKITTDSMFQPNRYKTLRDSEIRA